MCQSFTTVERQPFNKRFTFHHLKVMASFLHKEIWGRRRIPMNVPFQFSKHLKTYDVNSSLLGDLSTEFSPVCHYKNRFILDSLSLQ